MHERKLSQIEIIVNGKFTGEIGGRFSISLPLEGLMKFSSEGSHALGPESHKSVLRYLRPESQRSTMIVLPRHSPLRS